METIPFPLVYIASWLSITAGVYGLFSKAGDLLKKESREKLAQSLKGLDLPEKANWPEMFADLFDRVFGEKHFSFKCFLRSAIASMLFAVVTALTLEGATRGTASAFEMVTRTIALEGALFTVIILGVALLFVNAIPDYLSLYETRIILNWMKKSPSRGRILVVLCLDTLLTGAIFSGVKPILS